MNGILCRVSGLVQQVVPGDAYGAPEPGVSQPKCIHISDYGKAKKNRNIYMSAKIGRNQVCPCGSNLKYKKCCGNVIHRAPSINNAFIKLLNNENEQRFYKHKYGLAKEIIHSDFKNYKVVAVGNELTFSQKWKTFPDFLGDYLCGTLGTEWGNEEIRKPFEKRHEILKWHYIIAKHHEKLKVKSGIITSSQPIGAMKAWYQLAYDLYTIRHNAELQDFLVQRLKNMNQFQGALFEASVTAILIHAGYEIIFENEQDGSKKHPEFIAKNKKTGELIAVEAKSRHRPGVLGQNGVKQERGSVSADIRRIINKAFQKQSDIPLIVFVNINVPSVIGKYEDSKWFQEIERFVAAKESRCSPASPFPASGVMFTNTPYVWDLENIVTDHGWGYARNIKIPKVSLSAKSVLSDLSVAAQQSTNIPNFFPEF